MSLMLNPVRFFEPQPVPRIWGGESLGFGPGIGEVWLAEEPLLVKLLDPKAWLSVQVHPPHAYALRVEGKPGKYEAWYVLSPGEIVYGFSRPVTREEVLWRAQAGTLDEVLNRVRVEPGQVVYLPAGTVHAWGPGSGSTRCRPPRTSPTAFTITAVPGSSTWKRPWRWPFWSLPPSLRSASSRWKAGRGFF